MTKFNFLKRLTYTIIIFFGLTITFTGCKKGGGVSKDTFDCISGNCEVSSNGAYASSADCEAACGNTTGTHDCVSGNCITSTNGAYASLADCQSNCSDSTAYNCVSGNCESDANGTYASLADCQSNCSNTGSGCGSSSTFTDPRDGQTYCIVEIGTQTWFAENLRYSGSISIPQVISDADWDSLWTPGDTTGQAAWCYFDNNTANDTIYGKLYNWYAVNTGTLCPNGWHIPTKAEWTELINFLGGPTFAGDKMKNTTGWYRNPITARTNSSGFTGLPGGVRTIPGTFASLLTEGYWWSSTESYSGGPSAWFLELKDNAWNAFRAEYPRAYAISCRCLKD